MSTGRPTADAGSPDRAPPARAHRRRPQRHDRTGAAWRSPCVVALTRGDSPPTWSAAPRVPWSTAPSSPARPTSLPDMSGAGAARPALAGLVGPTTRPASRSATRGSIGPAPTRRPPKDLDVRRGELVPVGSPPPAPTSTRPASGPPAFSGSHRRLGRRAAVGACAAPRSSWWFTGLGADLDHSSQLVLTNLDPGPSVVDVNVFGPDGEIDTVGTRGITVRPGEATTFSLADVAPQTTELVVNVQASRGRIAVAASDRYAAGAGGPGRFEWVGGPPCRPARSALPACPRQLPPRRSSWEPVGLRGAARGRGGSARGGSFVPTELEEISVAPGTSRPSTCLTCCRRREAVAVRVRAQVPVVASLRAASRPDLPTPI